MTPSDEIKPKTYIQNSEEAILKTEKRMSVNELLQQTIDKLNSEKGVLINTICDLKELLSRLSLEHAKEAENHLSSLKAYAYKVKRIQLALRAAEEHAGHFDDVKVFWSNVVNQ